MKLIISRSSAYADKLRSYKIMIDENLTGTIDNGQTIELELPKGKHEVYLKIDWCRSNKVVINGLKDSDVVSLKGGSSLSGLKVFLGLFYVFFNPTGYLFLKTNDEQVSQMNSSAILDQGI